METLRYKLIAMFASIIIAIAVLAFVSRKAEKRARAISVGELGKINILLDNQIHMPISFWGSSTTLVHVSPRVVDSITGSSSFNFGLDGTLFQQYSGFLKSYSEKAEPSLIVIGLNITDFHPRSQIYHPQFYTYAVSEPNVKNALSSIDPSLTWKMDMVPLYSLTLFDAEYYANLNNSGKEHSFLKVNKGYEPQYRTGFKDSEKFDYDSIEIHRPFVDDLIRKVKEMKTSGHRVVIFISPMYFKAFDHIKNMNEFNVLLDEIRLEGVPIINLFQSPLSKQKKLFYNYLHMNAAGAELFSAELSHELLPYLE